MLMVLLLFFFVLDFGHCVNTVIYFTNYNMFSFSLICASTSSTTMGRSVLITITGDSFAGFASKGDWFALCTSVC